MVSVDSSGFEDKNNDSSSATLPVDMEEEALLGARLLG